MPKKELRDTIAIPKPGTDFSSESPGGKADDKQRVKAQETEPTTIPEQQLEPANSNSEPAEKELQLTEDNIKAQFKKYLKREEGKIGPLSATALNNTFRLEENRIIVQLTNLVEVDALEAIKPDLSAFIRSVFSQSDLQIAFEINAQNAIERPYTPKEKLESMIKKNPALGKLKNTLDLDTDF